MTDKDQTRADALLGFGKILLNSCSVHYCRHG
jgi:hypothetical protein